MSLADASRCFITLWCLSLAATGPQSTSSECSCQQQRRQNNMLKAQLRCQLDLQPLHLLGRLSQALAEQCRRLPSCCVFAS